MLGDKLEQSYLIHYSCKILHTIFCQATVKYTSHIRPLSYLSIPINKGSGEHSFPPPPPNVPA